MKITFDLRECGAANNGGTSTIFNSANILHKLGNEVVLVSDVKNKFNWFELDGPVYKVTEVLPDADILMATGAKSVKHVMAEHINKGKKYWWIRAHETWVISDENVLFDLYRQKDLKLLTNSICIKKYIEKQIEKKVKIIRPGNDITVFKPTRRRIWEKQEYTLGALYNPKERKRFEWIPEIYYALKERYPIKLRLFGDAGKGPEKYTEPEEYLVRPDKDQLCRFYNDVDFWIAPSMSEGLHRPPQEAMLSGCLVIGATEPLSGMIDYLEHGKTGYTMAYWSDAIKLISRLIDTKGKNINTITNAGRQRIKELGDREYNMKHMLKMFKWDIRKKTFVRNERGV